MDLSVVPMNDLLVAMRDRSHAGVMCITLTDGTRTAVWWGDRTRCLGLASRAVHGINLEESDADVVDEDDTDEETLETEFPQMGQYL